MSMSDRKGLMKTGVRGNRGSTTTLLLILLLVIIGAAGYLYYFTDIIRPRGEGEKIEQQPITMPMPARQLPMTTAQVPLPKATPAPGAKTAPVPSAQTPAPQSSKPSQNLPMPPKGGKKTEPVQQPKQQAAEPERKPSEKHESAKKKVGYSLLIGTYVLDDKLDKDKEKIVKAGLEPIVTPKGTRKVTMNRLFVGSFAEKQKAEAEFNKVKKQIGSAFLIQEKGKYAVYAGSYYVEKTAVHEQDRLAALGMTLVLKKADVPVPANKLTAGRFRTVNEAQKGAAMLKKQGIKASVIRVKE